MVGVLVALTGAAAFSVMNVLVRSGMRSGESDNGLRVTLTINVVVFTVLISALFASGYEVTWTVYGVSAFVAAGLLATFLGRYTLFGSIRLIGAARATAVKNATPLVSVALAVVVLREVISLLAVLGMGSVMLGVYLVIREARNHANGGQSAALAIESGSSTPPGVAMRNSRARAYRRILDPLHQRQVLLGVMLAGSAALSLGVGHMFRKVGVDAMPDPLVGATIGSWTALLALFTVSMVRGELGRLTAFTGMLRGSFWMAGVAGAVGQLCFFTALAFAPLAHVAVVAASETVITVMLAALWIQRSEQVTRRLVAPAMLVFGGSAIIAIAP